MVTAALVMLSLFFAGFLGIFSDVQRLVERADSSYYVGFALALTFYLIAQYLRVRKTKIILDLAAKSSLLDQIKLLTVGKAFNLILPFQLGHIIRAWLISARTQISFQHSIVAIVVEQSIDILLVSCSILVLATFIHVTPLASTLAIMSGGLSLLLLCLLLLLAQENSKIIRLVWKISGYFNPAIRNTIRFKLWLLILSLHKFLRTKQSFRRYVGLTLGSWTSFALSALIIVFIALPNSSLSDISAAAAVPYIFYPQAGITNSGTALTLWFMSTLPLGIIGVLALVFMKSNKKSNSRQSRLPKNFKNKLLHQEDLSQEFPAFLDAYFSSHSLSQALHEAEVKGDFSLVKYFKGGSDAITVLALKQDKLFVRKIVPIEYMDRLRSQHAWLNKRKDFEHIVNVLGEQEAAHFYAIDLEYRPNNISLFEYAHARSLKESTAILDEVWSYMFEHVYKLAGLKRHANNRDEYVDNRFEKRIEKAAVVSADLHTAMQGDKIYVNGELLDNYHTVMRRIKLNKQAWDDVATYRASSAIHGDLTVDNILVDTVKDTPILIDPSDDNQIQGPVLDFGRHMQSLFFGYEFLNLDDEAVKLRTKEGISEINFHENRSARYMQLAEHVVNVIMPKYLKDSEQRAVLFHVGLFYGRLLTHRVAINPDNVLKFYGTSIKALNQFIEQYENKEHSV